MPDLDAQSLADHAIMIGLVTRPQAREAVSDADDGTLAAVSRSFLRKGLLTSWQIDRLQKEDPTGFFYGGCKVLFHVAEGTFARVYRGVREDTGQAVAVKVLRNRFVPDREAVGRFHKEAEAGMKLRHPNIVQILNYGEEDKRHYIILEYVEGANLRDFLKIRNRIEQHDALPLMIGLARGLKYSIENGVTHRDIKATNILISNAGEAKLVDFGLATIESDDKKSQMTSQRTVDYSALERTCNSEKGDPRSDIYFLGSVFYQMLTGQVAMKETESKDMLAKMLKRSFGAIVPLGEHRLAPDPKLSVIVEKMMKVDLKARYQTMHLVLKDLETFAEHSKSGITGMEPVVDEKTDFFANLDDLFNYRPGTDDADHPAHAEDFLLEAADAADRAPHAGQSGVNAALRPNILCVETQTEIQDAFRKSLTKMGYRVILVGDPEVAAERFRESPPEAVIFDVDGLGAESIDSFNDMNDKAQEDGRDLAALVLLGPKQFSLKSRLPTGKHIIVLSKPVKMKLVQATVSKLAPLH